MEDPSQVEESPPRGRLGRWIAAQPALASALEFARSQASKPVPRGLSWLYTAGTVAAFFFAIQFITGLLLLMVYVPDEKLAYKSVQTIEHKMQLGSLLRQMHAWGATFIVIVLLLHILKVLWHGSYKRPRELTWVVGFLLLVSTLGFCLSGYLLPWNQLGYWATNVAVAGVGSVPGIGATLKGFVCGGADVSGATIGRFFALHVTLLPLLLSALIGLHLALIVKLGIAPKSSVTEEAELGHKGALELHGSEPFFPRQVYRELLVLNLGFALLVTVAVFFPWELGEPKSSSTPEGIKPEWYFLPFYQFLKYFDDQLYAYLPFLGTLDKKFGVTSEFLGISCINLMGLLVFLLPFLDRGKQRKITKRPVFATLALLVIVGTGVLGALGYLSERRVHFMGEVYEFSPKGYPRRLSKEELDAATSPPAPPVPVAPAAPAPVVSYRADGLPPGGTCGAGGCHEEEHAQWKDSVHDRNQIECSKCHGGIDTKPTDPIPEGLTPETYAHVGIKQKKSGGAGRPAKKEIPDFCGKCHDDVRSVFSPAHLESPPEGQSAKTCVTCHSNHSVKEATDATFDAKDAYSDAADPRTAPFLDARKALRDIESDRAAAEQKVAALGKTGYPTEALERDLEQAVKKSKEVRPLLHGLDRERENLAKKAAEMREALGFVSADAEKAAHQDDDRWKLVAGVWVVAAVLSALILWRLRAM